MIEIALPLIENLGLLSLCAIAVVAIRRFRQSSSERQIVFRIAQGALFGATASFVMLHPVEPLEGYFFDTRVGPLLLAGTYLGPVGAIIASFIAAATRFGLGEAGRDIGILGIICIGCLGVLVNHLIQRGRLALNLRTASLLSILAGGLALLPIFIFLPIDIAFSVFSKFWLLVPAGAFVGTLVLFVILDQEDKRAELEVTLKQREEEARSASETKSRFVKSMSHEIRTPLNAIVGYVDLVRGTSLDKFQEKCLSRARTGTDTLLELVDSVLEYTQIADSQVEVREEKASPSRTVRSTIDYHLPHAEERGIPLKFGFAPGIPETALFDAAILQRAFSNILSNAIKYTDKGQVTVDVFARQEHPTGEVVLSITVTDTGIGMTSDIKERLFSPFERGSIIGRPGTGLGLVVAKSLLEAAGGSISIESTFNKGTTARIIMPIKTVQLATVDGDPVPSADPSAGAASGALKILVAEDVAMNAEMVKLTLETMGHEVEVATNGLEAVKCVSEKAYDLVLMDVQMPEMDGLSATRAIRLLPDEGASIPIVALTAYATREDVKRCLDAGMDDFLSKPLDREKLSLILARWSEASHAA